MNTKNDPLWVVDGVPYEGDINNINAADIESISVLKRRRVERPVRLPRRERRNHGHDQACEGRRGHRDFRRQVGHQHPCVADLRHRGGCGRILRDALQVAATTITRSTRSTLPGRQHRRQQAADVERSPAVWVTTSSPCPTARTSSAKNGRLNPRAKQGRLVTDAKGQQFYLQPDNWLDEIYKSSSFRQEYNVSVSGATDRANFFASLGYLDNTGIVDGSSNERYTARLRADYQAKKWLKVGGNMSTPISSGTTATKPTTTATVRGAKATPTAETHSPRRSAWRRSIRSTCATATATL